MAKRVIDDLDGMYEDLRENYLTMTVAELTEIIMETNHSDQDEDDLIADWESLCNGEIKSDEQERRDREIDHAWEMYKDSKYD